MTKKEMEKRIADLERELSELKSQMLALALRGGGLTVYTVPLPPPQPMQPVPTWPPQPQYPIITC